MAFAGMSYIGILLAAIAAFAFGALWYGGLSKPWLRAARIDPTTVKMSPSLFVVSFVAELIMAWVLAGVIGHLGDGQVTIRNGLISGAMVWLGFMATVTTVNQRYEGYGWDLTVIDAGHWLGVALIMGVVIGWWGV
ncbi:MAG: DUF1761 domain-containing protein [Rhizobiaceae bacterium]|nr:DUF1761 domain-containing protein [Rhizobiaceae bacterium]MCV0407636.1 DUF1761 domain-containing protein [Rhizobiaceae bacterium]